MRALFASRQAQVETAEPMTLAGVHLVTDDGTAVAGAYKAYDSATVREWEPFAAALNDMHFVLDCCQHLLENPVAASGADPTLQRALWDGLLAAIFKHYGEGANREVKGMIDAYLAQREDGAQEAFKDWETERNRRVAHSVGFREQYRVAVAVDSDGNPLVVHGSHAGALRPEDEGVRWVRAVAAGLALRFEERFNTLMAAIASEVDALPNSELLALPVLEFGQLGMNRAPGRPIANR